MIKTIIPVLAFVLAPFLASGGESPRRLGLTLADNSIDVKINPGKSVSLCTARINYLAHDGAPIDTEESYLIQYDRGHPEILDRIDGFGVSLELRDIDRDGVDELVAFFSGGASNYGIKIYSLKSGRIVPLSTQPTLSNMRSIKIELSQILVERQQRISAREALIETLHYHIEGDKLKSLGSTKRTVTK